jgi:hypothetical protein
MPRPRALLSALALFLLTTSLAAQEYAIDRCESLRIPLGVLDGGGVVRYRLGKDGRADTTSLEVMSTVQLSASALRSAAARQLAACRFHRPPTDRLLVDQMVQFTRERVNVGPARVADSAVAAMVVAPAAIPVGPVYDSLPILEEHPRAFDCRVPRMTGMGGPEGTFRSEAEANAAFDKWAARNSGRVRFRMLIAADGKVVRDSVQIISTENPSVTNDAVASAARCRYAPGRVAGVAVATWYTTGGGRTFVRAP